MFELLEDSDDSASDEETVDDKDNDDDSGSSDEDTDEADPRTICVCQQLKEFDPSFSKKKWNKLKNKERKMISSIIYKQILLASKDKMQKTKSGAKDDASTTSNRTLSLDRSHFITAMRGIYIFTHTHIQ